jgi:hypothetical protein
MTAHRRFLAMGIVVAIALAAQPAAQSLPAVPAVDEAVIARIKIEGFQHSQVMTTLSWLSDVHGPRLTGSDGLRRASEWARDQLSTWGLANAALEPYGRTTRGWALDGFDITMRSPEWSRVIGYPKAYSPSLAAPLTGTPVVVDVKGPADFEKYRGKLRGAIVMNGRPAPARMNFSPEATRLTDADLAAKAGEMRPTASGDPATYAEEEEDWLKTLEKQTDVLKFFASEGIGALVEASSTPEAVRVGGFYDHAWQPTFPGFVIAREHYGRILRLLDLKQPVSLTLSLTTRITPSVEAVNVIAELPGTDPVLKHEVVMIGAHLDSWHAGTGATDNGAGSAVVMEALRILKAIGVSPKRTIRLALWSGEEQDYFGSLGYVRRHFGDPSTLELKPEHQSLSVYLNLDNGAGRIRGVNLQGNEAARPLFEAWLRPFAYLGATTITTLNTSGTDHMSFDAVGLPGFQFIQDPLNYETRAHHSNLDVYENAVPADLEQASVILASTAYHAAMRDAVFPRKPVYRKR